MSIARSNTTIRRLPLEILKKWCDIPPAIAGDCMNRQNVMSSHISPIISGMKLYGQARTVAITHGDNSALHAALTLLIEGDILVVEGGGLLDRAVWGGIMNRVAIIQKLGGVVIDGAIRDLAELKEMSLPVFASSFVPTGPTKGGGGFIDVQISCGGVSVSPGDIIVGDDDGIAVIPLKRSEKILNASIERVKMENTIISRLNNGELHKNVFNIETVPLIEDLD